jgi:hypothetical protein
MRYPKIRKKLTEDLIGIMAEAEYYSGFNKSTYVYMLIEGIKIYIQNNYRRRTK